MVVLGIEATDWVKLHLECTHFEILIRSRSAGYGPMEIEENYLVGKCKHDGETREFDLS